MEYNRTYAHKTYGELGRVILSIEKGKFILNGQELPQSSVDHLIGTYALQTLQDAYAGAKSTDEALASYNKKLDAILNGTLGSRGSGDGVDERTRVMRSIVQATAKAKFGAKSADWATFTGLSDDDQNAKLDAWYDGNKAAYDPAIEDEMAARAAKRERQAALRNAVDIKM